GDDPQSANPFVQVRIATGMSIARNVIIVRSSSAVIAMSGGAGTLSEIAHCLQLGVPVVGLDTHDVSQDIVHVTSPEEAVDKAISLAERAK
ncbi:MAG: LOG family protein, partial [Candidatus Krumholzibacteria bacterium]|nr:LOG family protein [Candidatus Krumholzibacteria bacterium]